MELKKHILIGIGMVFNLLYRSDGSICVCGDIAPYQESGGPFSAYQKVVLDEAGRYMVQWEVDGSLEIVKFTVLVETLGYIGFGFSNDGK